MSAEQSEEHVDSKKKRRQTRKINENGTETYLSYPKIHFSITIDIPCLQCAYINITGSVLGETKPIGFTDSVTTTSDETLATFIKEFDVINYIGIDENQSITLDIMDGDTLKIKKGYLFASVSVRARDLHKPVHKVPVYRGDDIILGYLIFNSYITTEDSIVSLVDRDVGLKYLRSAAPTEAKIREENSSFFHSDIQFLFEFKLKNICPFPLSIAKKGIYFFFKFCITDDDSEVIDDLFQFYKSELIKSSPFKFSVDQVSVKRLAIEHNSVAPLNDNTLLVIQLFCGGFYRDIGEVEPTCCSYAIINAKKFVTLFRTENKHTFHRKFKYNAKFEPQDHVTKRDVLHDHVAKLLGEDAGTTKIRKKKKKQIKTAQESMNDLLNDLSRVMTEKDIDDEIKGLNREFDLEESDEEDANSDEETEEAKKVREDKQKHKKKPLCGTVTIRAKKAVDKIEVTPGDLAYELEVKAELKRQTDLWIEQMKTPFQKASEAQAYTLKRATEIVEIGQEGWQIEPIFVLDFQLACFHHLADLVLQGPLSDDKKKTTKLDHLKSVPTVSFRGSRVLDMFSTVFDVLSSHTQHGAFRAYAGGGVQAPYAAEGSALLFSLSNQSPEQSKPKVPPIAYPSYGYPRQHGFPLCQEYLLDNIDKYAAANGFTVSADRNLILKKIDKFGSLMEALKQTERTKSWGGTEYVRKAKYRGLESIKQAFVESTVIYQPVLMRPNSKYIDVPYEDDFARNIPSTLSKDFPGDSGRPSSTVPKIHKTRFHTSYVDGGIKTSDNPHELWDQLSPHRHLHHRGNFISYDIDTIDLLLKEPPKSSKSINIVTWILAKTPSELYYNKIEKVIEQQITDSSRRSSLLIVLAPDCRLDIDDEDPESLQFVAQPFQKFLNFYTSTVNLMIARASAEVESNGAASPRDELSSYPAALRETMSVNHPRVKICHLCPFSEIVAQSYVYSDEKRIADIDREGALPMTPNTHARALNGLSVSGDKEKAFAFPAYQDLVDVLKIYLPLDSVEKVIGHSLLKYENKESKTPEGSSKKKGLFDFFTEDEKLDEGALEEVDDNVESLAELAEIKKRFDEEYALQLSRELREYVSLCLADVKKRYDAEDPNWRAVNEFFCNTVGSSPFQKSNAGCSIS